MGHAYATVPAPRPRGRYCFSINSALWSGGHSLLVSFRTNGVIERGLRRSPLTPPPVSGDCF
jgi:hypothetical protein